MSSSRTGKVLSLSLGHALASAATLLTAAVLTRRLSLEDLATYRQTLLAYTVAAPLLTLGLTSGIFYLLSSEPKRNRAILIEAMVLLGAMGTAYGALIASQGSMLAAAFSNPSIAATLPLLIPYIIVNLPAGLINGALITRGSVRTLATYNVLSNVLLCAAVTTATFLSRDPYWLIVTYVVVGAATSLTALMLVLRSSHGASTPRFESVATSLTYSVPLALASMMGTITLQLDKLIVSALRTPEEFAIYSTGAIEVPLIGMVTGAISAVILADMAALCKANQKPEALALFRRAAVRSGLVLLPSAVFLMVYANEFITLLFSDKYAQSADVFRIYLVALPLRVVMYGAALMALNMTRVVLWRAVGDLIVNAILSYALVSLFGVYGAAAATVATLAFWTVPFNLKMIAKGFGCKPHEVLPITQLARIFGLAAVACAVALMITANLEAPALLNFGIAFVLFSGFYLSSIWIFVEDSRDVIQYVARRLGRTMRRRP